MLYVFKITASLTQPLTLDKVITTKDYVYKTLRVGKELLLGQSWGYLEVFDINTSTVTHTHQFTEGGSICDIIAIDGSNYLLAAEEGLLKTTKDQLINIYFKGKWVRSLCHITDSFYLVGFFYDQLIVWNEKTD